MEYIKVYWFEYEDTKGVHTKMFGNYNDAIVNLIAMKSKPVILYNEEILEGSLTVGDI